MALCTSRLLIAVSLCAAVLGACGSKTKAPPVPVESGGPVKAQLGFVDDAQQVEAAPIALTGSDGTGLALVSLEAKSVVQEPLAFTELHLTFHNPEPERREGRFHMVLPEAAAISRFAMKVNGEWQEGEVVERRFAQQVYEDFLHRKQDPALLEQAAGNEFSARVFPIEPSADKEIILSYSEELPQRDQPLRLLLAGLPRLSRLAVEVQVGSKTGNGVESAGDGEKPARLTLEKRDFAPTSDLLVQLPWRKPFALRSGELVVARVAPVPGSAPEKLAGLTVLFDTSASRALGFAAQIERLGALLAELVRQNAGDFPLRLVAFDQDAEELYRGDASGFALRDKGRLLARGALGATNLAQALAQLSEQPSDHPRLLLVSDGVVSAGEEDGTRLREAVARLSAHGLVRLDVLAEGGIRDRDLLTSLTQSGLKQAGAVLDAREAAPALATRLLRSVRERVSVHVAGARWVHPAELTSVQAGDERLVFAEVPVDQPVQIELAEAGFVALPTLEAPRPLVERAWARAKIAALTHTLHASGARPAPEREALEREIVALSTKHRVLSERTALLVLESEADYLRFGLAQSALSAILQVGADGVELVERKPAAPRVAALEMAKGEGAAEDESEPPAPAPAELARDRGESPAPQPASAPSAAAPPPEPSAERRERAAPPPERKASASAMADKVASASPDDLRAALEAAPASNAAMAAAPRPAAPSAQGRAAGSAGVGGLPTLGATTGGAATSEASVAVASPRLVPRAQVVLHYTEGLASAEAARVLRSSLTPRARACYERADAFSGGSERINLEFAISERGSVNDVFVAGGSVADQGVKACVLAAARQLQFEKPAAGSASLQAGVELSFAAAAPAPSTPQQATAPRPRPRPRAELPTPSIDEAYSGDLASVLSALRANDTGSALATALAAHERDPGDVMALIALGEALEAQHDKKRAARVYGSLIDLFPARADMRRMAGERLERLAEVGLPLALDSYRKALVQRPDHPSAHRLLAYALLKQGLYPEAFAALEAALGRTFDAARFPAVERILGEDLALVGAAWLRIAPDQLAHVAGTLATYGLAPELKPSLRFVLNWETDANDVDFHIYDGSGGHASYLQKRLPSGGELYADVTTGYGPECFAIRGAAQRYPYVLQAHYFARGPMGYGMGKLEVIQHDGKGQLRFAEHPFVIMKDRAFVELARLQAPL